MVSNLLCNMKEIRSFFSITGLQRIPLKTCALIIALGLLFKENYPFSNFPMYSKFNDYTFYVYITDAKNQPIPVEVLTAIRTGRLKKIYDNQCRTVSKNLHKRKRELTLEERQEIGMNTLRWFFENTRAETKPFLRKYNSIKIYHVDIMIEGGEVTERPHEMVAELDLSYAD